MRTANLHTHTRYCDGEGEPADFCRAAEAAGLAALGFSAHAPVDQTAGFATGWHIPQAAFAAYREDVLACKAAFRGRLAVFLGLEADYIEGCQSPRDFAPLNLDYLIGSLHCVLPPGLSAPAFFKRAGKMLCVDGPAEDWARLTADFFEGDVYRLTGAYWETLERMIAAGGFDILGHADLIKKNNGNASLPPSCRFNEDDPRYQAGLTRAARALAGTDIVVEVNTGGINRGRTAEPYPSLAFLRILREQGTRITISTDAHKPGDTAGAYKAAVDAAREAGYREAAFFGGRRDGRPLWEREPLPPT